MVVNSHGQVRIQIDELFESIYSGKKFNIARATVDDPHAVDQYNASIDINADNLPKLSKYTEFTGSTHEFDDLQQHNLLIPKKYQDFPIVEWLFSQCKTDTEIDRVTDELTLFIEREMITVLQYLKYIVDTMRTNSILWGVGRGSSVASYCLYLIGIHKIDSIKYNLDIKEFLK
jgi:DNA polymerase III alpha subunit